ncbi:MAG TPA: sugar phosphate nucleotidyltransferase [Terriglobia bacterium]|nr:sugar phosphate nucleotidyltransferase [Terriglobia bacterium]
MRIRKAVITAAGGNQRALPLQTLIQDGVEKSVLNLLIEQALTNEIGEVGVVVWPGDEDRYAQAAGSVAGAARFIPQQQPPRGYGHALYCAREFVADEPFLHIVGDHLYVSGEKPGVQRLIELAESESCSASGVQPTRESLLNRFGAVAGRRLSGRQDVYRVETVLEKPTPTEAEQRLIMPGIRAGYYLCFFGIHIFTPTVMDLLGRLLASEPGGSITLSTALAQLARQEQYLALEDTGRRYDLGARYGVLTAQLALALNGHDRDEVLTHLLELLAEREMASMPFTQSLHAR